MEQKRPIPSPNPCRLQALQQAMVFLMLYPLTGLFLEELAQQVVYILAYNLLLTLV
jgi:hypothetical protein